ncbi:hypothetical protein PISMIDRAFT_674437 [Pisolithus microcarpus 441]|uniref:Uncharacterized protein n=1 Tax=Pisolithus microcarpus 441 TaxID=765257 RepID=A0A0C9ZFJ1_9AGAM|nr:hypothetical protein PISMIDRAFT_677795 [Pisolithus microcarpus 441]KIK27568.1 hypothetical protein PISMIDRAFT_674437 [Pisolithus microcarpus 441]
MFVESFRDPHHDARRRTASSTFNNQGLPSTANKRISLSVSSHRGTISESGPLQLIMKCAFIMHVTPNRGVLTFSLD